MSDALKPLIGTAAERPLTRAEAETAFEALFEFAGDAEEIHFQAPAGRAGDELGALALAAEDFAEIRIG